MTSRSRSGAVTLAVIAKAPVPGHSKTRLCPPCTPTQAAVLAAAALADTVAAVAATPAGRRAVVLDGAPGHWLAPGIDVVPQRGGDLAQRLAAAFVDLGGPVLMIGMDTPQVTPRMLAGALRALGQADAVLGSAVDGGYWAIGLRRPDPAVFACVPMSDPTTCAVQRSRLQGLRLATRELPTLRDVDDIADARAVAAQAPWTCFARELAALDLPAAEAA